MTTPEIDLEPGYFEEMLEILERHLRGTGASVYLFGSRAKGNALKCSDIDLAVEMPGGLPPKLRHCLCAAFADSLLPYRVDVVDYHALSPIFKKNVDGHRILLARWPWEAPVSHRIEGHFRLRTARATE